VDRYNAVRLAIKRERAHIRREGGRRAPLLSHIIEFPQTIMAEWVPLEMDHRLDQSEHRAAITQDEWEYAQGCNPTIP
jgi:hypothetical protein